MSKKLVIGGFVALVAVLSVSSFIFAQEDDPDLAPFNATVTIQSQPAFVPLIVTVNDSFGGNLLLSTLDFFISPVELSSVDVQVIFIAEDPEGVADLPTGASIPVGTGGPGSISINLTYSGSRAGVSSVIGANPGNTVCHNMPGYSGVGAGQRAYNCTITGALPFYYEPTNATTNLWRVGVVVRDISNTNPIASSHNITRSFTYLQRRSLQPLANLSWTGLNTALPNRLGTNNLSIRNTGNMEIANVSLTGYNLTGDGYTHPPTAPPYAWIPITSIRSDGTQGNECGAGTATQLTENLAQVVDGFAVNYGASVSGQGYFCIHPALQTFEGGSLDLSDSPYTASGSTYPGTKGTRDWEVV